MIHGVLMIRKAIKKSLRKIRKLWTKVKKSINRKFNMKRMKEYYWEMQILKEEQQEVDMVTDNSNMEIETIMKNKKKSWKKKNIKGKHLRRMKIQNIIKENNMMKISTTRKISKNQVNNLQINDSQITLTSKISMLNITQKMIDRNKKAFKIKSKSI